MTPAATTAAVVSAMKFNPAMARAKIPQTTEEWENLNRNEDEGAR